MFQGAKEPDDNQTPTGQVRGQRWGRNQVKATGNSTGANLATIKKNNVRG